MLAFMSPAFCPCSMTTLIRDVASSRNNVLYASGVISALARDRGRLSQSCVLLEQMSAEDQIEVVQCQRQGQPCRPM
jgi:hypothetical protein